MARKLRIAVSAFFGLLTVALCVLWIRSYWQTDHLMVNRDTVAKLGQYFLLRLD